MHFLGQSSDREATAETQPLIRGGSSRRSRTMDSRDLYSSPGDEELGPEAYLTPLPWWRRYRKVLIIMTAVLGVVAVGLIITIAVVSTHHDPVTPTPAKSFKNVIVMITDGFGPASVTLARTLNGKPLKLDSMVRGTIRTKSANSLITDSAAGATAYSCGLKTNNTFIAVDPLGKACGTILEAAQRKGMRTGLVVTSRMTDATPASFSSHSISRYEQEFIALQQVNKGVDIMLGGGREYFLPENEGGVRKDGKNLLKQAADAGVTVATTKVQFEAIAKLPVLGLFSIGHLDYTIDMNTEQPTLAQMTAKALKLLSEDNEQGFFLLVEGSRIDHAGHDNDAAAHFNEVLAYDEAVKEVIDFAAKDEGTLVVSVSDHETGGLALGRTPRNGGYPVYEWYPEVIRTVRASASKIAAQIIAAGSNATEQLAAAPAILLDKAGFQVTQEELDLISPALQKPPKGMPLLNVIGNLIAYRAGIAWTTLGHTGVDINLYSFTTSSLALPGVEQTTKFGNGGNMENFHLGQYFIEMGDFDVQAVTDSLKNFNPVPVSAAVSKRNKGALSDPYHPEL